MSEKTDKFIEEVGKWAVYEVSTRQKWILPSVCIAQAALESGWNLDCKTLFGIKANDNNFKTYNTIEYVNGRYIYIQDNFVEHKNVADAINYYYNFMTETPRYSKCVNNTSCIDTLYYLIHTTDGLPYATDPNYIFKLEKIILDYDLKRFDLIVEIIPKYRIGDIVTFSKIFYTSESEEPLEPKIFKGKITYIKDDARNPYLINNNVGWVNGMYIDSIETSEELKIGDTVKVLTPIDIYNHKIALYYDYYEVMEISNNENPYFQTAVIGVDGVVTCRIYTTNIRKVN